MMTSSNGNIFRVTDHLCGEFTRSAVNSPHKSQWHGALMFSLIWAWISGWENNREAGDLRRYHAHYDVIVMCMYGVGWDVICEFKSISMMNHCCAICNIMSYLTQLQVPYSPIANAMGNSEGLQVIPYIITLQAIIFLQHMCNFYQ